MVVRSSGVCLQVLLFLASWALLRQSLCSDKVTLAWNFDGSATETDLELLVNPSREVIIFLLPEFSLASLSRLSDAYLQSSDGGILKNFKNLVESGGKKVLLNEPLTSKVLDHPSLSRIPSNEVFEIARWKRLSRVALKLTSWNDLDALSAELAAGNVMKGRIGLLSAVPSTRRTYFQTVSRLSNAAKLNNLV
ncbi:hypothetical protein D918_08819 [Trichuris suis]|nr:hypothetical protein D918_08819 [Trichuris suis]